MDPIVFLDQTSFQTSILHEISDHSSNIKEQFEKLYSNKLNCLLHQINDQLTINSIYSVHDCPQQDVWRYTKSDGLTLFPQDIDAAYLNEHTKRHFTKRLQVASAQAIDIIAVLTQMFSEQKRQCVIISAQVEILQQLVNDYIHLYNPTTQSRIKTSQNLFEPLPTEPWQNWLSRLQATNLSYIPRNLQDNIVASLNFSETEIPPNYRPRAINLGLCCINTKLHDQGIFCSRKPILRTLQTKGLSDLFNRCRQNALDLVKLIDWNGKNGIRVLRISSELFPHYTNPKAASYTLDQFQPILSEAGRLARKYRQRLTMHPGQYNVVGTPDPDCFQNTSRDLDYHAEILDRMGCDQDSVIVVHGGGQYKNKQATLDRWITQFALLSARVKRRLVLENCEKNFNIEDCLYVSQKTGVPVVFDTHHYDCYLLYHPEIPLQPPEFYIPKILETWTKRGIKPKFHISEQGSGQIGHHSDFIDKIPDYLLSIPKLYQISFDLMVEAKMKEQAIQTLYLKYPFIDPNKVNITPDYFPLPIQSSRRQDDAIDIIGDSIYLDELIIEDEEILDDEIIILNE